MKPKTELILYQCLWVADVMFRPTWRNMTGSFEEWAYKKGYLRQIHALEEAGWLESQSVVEGTERVYRLTQKGYLKALGGSLPPEQWERGWDGKWRVVVFDLPEDKRGLRNELRRQLKHARFGGLQGSVWVSPDSVYSIEGALKKTSAACGVMTFFEGTTCGGESPADVVASAWNFQKINRSYQDYQAHLKELPRAGIPTIREALLDWAREEKDLWSNCMHCDPLLPRELWPEGYLGETAWKKRIAILRRIGKMACKEFTNK
jgi:phenylacetic acid degradation operon negative regulatory protein